MLTGVNDLKKNRDTNDLAVVQDMPCSLLFTLANDGVGTGPRMVRAESGEAFCVFVANPKVDSAVKLHL
jgi:hypothetical protein